MSQRFLTVAYILIYWRIAHSFLSEEKYIAGAKHILHKNSKVDRCFEKMSYLLFK